MKAFYFLLLIGFTSASFHEMLDDVVDELTLDFFEGLEDASTSGLLKREIVENYMADARERNEIAEKLRDLFTKVLERIKEDIEEGKDVREEILEKLRLVREKMRALKIELGAKGKALLEKLKEQANDYIKTLLEKLDSSDRQMRARIEEAFAEVSLRELLLKVREHLLNNVDPETLKQAIMKLFDEGSEVLHQLLTTLKEKGRKRLLILLDHLLDNLPESQELRSIGDYWEKVKDYFKNLKIDLEEKYMKFGEWVKNYFDKGMEHSKDKIENIKAIAKEFAKHAKTISKEVGAEAKEFFHQYKDELGEVWDLLKEAFQRIKENHS